MLKKFFLFTLVVISLFCLFSCQHNVDDSNSNESKSKKIAVPVLSPAAGDYSEGFKTISINIDDSDADIYYTTDDSVPTNASNRYTGPFNIIGSKTVRAIAYSGENHSAVVTAKYNLNAGKTASQLGVITGVLALADNLSDEVKTKLASSTVYISSSELPGLVKEGKIGESFYIDGLDTSKSYDFYFSNKAPGTAINSRAARAARTPAVVQTDENGEPIVSVQIKTIPDEGTGTDLGQVILKPTGTITGKALKYDESGEEESDHTGITVFIPGTSFAAYTSKDGTFSMTGVPQGMYTIRAMYAGYTYSEQENILLFTETSDEPKAIIDSDFTLYYAKGTVKGSVLLGDKILDFSGISIVLTDAANAHSYTANTTETGNWTINDVTPGTYSVEFHKDGYVGQSVNDIIITGARVTNIARIVLKEDGGSICGIIKVENSTKAGVSVIAERAAEYDAQNNPVSKSYYALSSADGTYTFDSIAPGLYTITAAYPGYKNVTQPNVSVSIGDKINLDELIISEKTTYSITGSCVLAGMGSGFEGTTVLLQSSSDSNFSKSTTTNPEGVYTISDIDAGSYILTFSRTGFITNSSVTVDVGLKAITVVESVALQSNAGSIIGNVLLESADTNEGIAILITKENDSSVSYSTVTDVNGHYAIVGILPGTYRLQATKAGYNTGVSDPFSVSSGIVSNPSDMLLSISLRSLYGTVTLEGRTDYTGVRITATKTTSTKEIYSALSNKEGFYALSGMTPGEYILSYSFESYRSYTSSSVSLSNDSSINVDTVELAKATGKISGIVNLEGCTDHSGITVTLVGTDYSCVTQANGMYEFSVPSGNYPGGVRFEKEDFQLSAKAETIPVLTDSTYGVLTVEMKATANTLKGITTLAGTDDASGIKVTVDGLDSTVFSTTTDSEGNWQLEHIPLGYQTIRFSKTNVPDVTCEIDVIPCDYINIGSLEMIPDSATLKGYVFLNGMSDNANITVTVTTKDKDDIVARTTSDGAFTATNILASGSHTITFSKDGWDSQSITINDFEPLEERVIGTNREYVLKDTTAPAWGSTPVTINSGANFANDTKLHIDLSPVEKGSGIDKMSVQIKRTVAGETSSLYPSVYNWQNYQIGFDFDLGILPDQYVGNGTYELFIALKDKSGNISDKASKSITITDLVTSLSGVLTGDKLHLTEESSPYIVETDCLVSEGDTLVIEPGVEVRFAGGFSISVSGSIEARGTKEKKILFTSNTGNQKHTYTRTEWYDYYDDYGNWQGMQEREVEYVEDQTVYWNGIAINGGSVTTENTYNYVSGNIMEYCEFEYANTPLTIKASAYINRCYFHDCTNSIHSNGSMELLNSIVENGIYGGAYCVNNIIKGGVNDEWQGGTYINNTIHDGMSLCGSATVINNIFISSGLSLWHDSNINMNTFIDCNSQIIFVNREYTTGFAYNLTNNYWGSAQTQELESKGAIANISFISDYYDNFNYARVDYSNWATEPFENCGYSETGFVAFDYTINGYDLGFGGYCPESKSTSLSIGMKPQYHENPITQMRMAQSYEELKSTSWTSYISHTIFTVDKTKLVNETATLYVQVKDSKGNCSSAVCYNIPYDIPECAISLENGTIFGSTAKKQEVYFKGSDLGNISTYSIYLDGTKISNDDGFPGGSDFDTYYTLPLVYMASGTHTLKLTATDSVGNTGETSVSFTINRNFEESSVKDICYNSTTGQFYKDSNTIYLWHLDNDGKEDSGTAKITNYTHINGGFEGSASYLDGYIPLDLSANAFTVEFWTRGRRNIQLSNEDFEIRNTNYWSEYWDEWGCWYEYLDGANFIKYKYTTSEGNEIEKCDYNNQIGLDDGWHYWAYVYDGSYLALYYDGVCISSADGFTHTLNTNNNNLNISANGIVDEIRISSNARSADEINSYYKTAKPILDSNTGSLDATVW